MKKKFEILSIKEPEIRNEGQLEHDDYIISNNENRSRIRHLASTIISVCGMLVSASLVVLFFLIKENKNLFAEVYILFGAIFMLIITMALAVFSIGVYTATPVATQGERLNRQFQIIRREKIVISLAQIFMVVAMIAILTSLIAFALNVHRS